MSSASLPWWGWILAAVLLWLVGLSMDEEEHPVLKALFAVATIVSALIGVIRFIKWVWSG